MDKEKKVQSSMVVHSCNPSYLGAIKRTKFCHLQQHGWKGMEVIMQSEIRQAQKDKYHTISLILDSKKLISYKLRGEWWLPEAGEGGRRGWIRLTSGH
jgi:hypothetical protein